MNWDALGAIGELVGAAAVVLTLGFPIDEVQLVQKYKKFIGRIISTLSNSKKKLIGCVCRLFLRACPKYGKTRMRTVNFQKVFTNTYLTA